jgi:hypothetical protein
LAPTIRHRHDADGMRLTYVEHDNVCPAAWTGTTYIIKPRHHA